MVHILAKVIREACCKAVGLLDVEIVDALFFLGFPAKEFFLLYNLKKDYFFCMGWVLMFYQGFVKVISGT